MKPKIVQDIGHKETEAKLKEIEKKIKEEYKRAAEETKAKLNDYLRRFQIKDKLKLQAVAKGMITYDEYQTWRTNQLLVGQRWQELVNQLTRDYVNYAQITRSIAYGELPDIYAGNFNYGTYLFEVQADIADLGTAFTLYNKDAVAQLFKDGTFWHAPGQAVSEKIAAGKLAQWEKGQIQSVMMQGILQGESISHLADRLQSATGDSILESDIKNRDKMTAKQVSDTLAKRNRAAAIRNARTMVTGVQNAARIDSYKRGDSIAKKYGLKVMKQWLATLDGRTRHWHAELDGETIPNEEPFVNDYGEIDYPGDPGAEPANVYNCRCTLLPVIQGLGFNNSVRPEDSGRVMGKGVDTISYDDWKAGHYNTYSDPIDKQDQIAARMKAVYNAEYRRYAHGVQD
jgi:hypothetical protein